MLLLLPNQLLEDPEPSHLHPIVLYKKRILMIIQNMLKESNQEIVTFRIPSRSLQTKPDHVIKIKKTVLLLHKAKKEIRFIILTSRRRKMLLLMKDLLNSGQRMKLAH